MPRPFVTAVAAALFILSGIAGCKENDVGDPCTPEAEYRQSFTGFSEKQQNIESRSFQCMTRVCIVNHFQGRVTCPYGQDSTGIGPDGTEGCVIPGAVPGSDGGVITGDPNSANGRVVEPQCVERRPDQAVYCSCRCANVDGRTDDGAHYCSCPSGFSCEQLVPSIGTGDTGMTGGYCIKKGTAYKERASCDATCHPTNAPCL